MSRIFFSWAGPGNSYDYPTSTGMDIQSANEMSRWLPFRDDDMSRQVMVKSGQNQSGQQWENIHAGVKTAHKSDNYGKM